MKVLATLFDLKTGVRKVTEHEYPDDYDLGSVHFHWTDGNYECDCNRSLFLYDYDEKKMLSCNTKENQIVLEKLVADGKEIEL